MNGTHRRGNQRQSEAMNETHRRRGRELHQLVHQLGLARIVRNLGQFLEGRHLASARRGRRSASGGEGAHLRAQAQSGAINDSQHASVRAPELETISSCISLGGNQ